MSELIVTKFSSWHYAAFTPNMISASKIHPTLQIGRLCTLKCLFYPPLPVSVFNG